MSTPREMTKSPLAVVRDALSAATSALPAYTSKFSKRTFTRPQLVAVLSLKAFLKTDYRGVVAYLRDWSDLRDALGRSRVPHFTTLQKAASGLKKSTSGTS
jgi:hypothetical protein